MTFDQACDVRPGDVVVERKTGKWLNVLVAKYRGKLFIFICRDNVGAMVEIEHRKVRRP